jgi:hypothetical protein
MGRYLTLDKKRLTKCMLCEKSLIIEYKKVQSSNSRRKVLLGECKKGICFNPKVWFCNKCWEELLDERHNYKIS